MSIKTPEALALERLAEDIMNLEEEEAQCKKILAASKTEGFAADINYSNRSNYRITAEGHRDHSGQRVARLLGNLIVEYTPKMIEAMLVKRRAEVQAHRERVITMYRPGDTRSLTGDPLRLPFMP